MSVTVNFNFESDHFPSACGEYVGLVDVEIEVDGNANFTIQSMYHVDADVLVKLADFPEKEQDRILRQTQDLADVWWSAAREEQWVEGE